jgi:predicted protein tyrosine phosphatase
MSLLDPGTPFPDAGYGARHLKLAFHDVERAAEGETAPNMEHMRELLAFVRSWTRDRPLLIHCYAGISRSSAAAFVAACALNPDVDESEIARTLRRASANARPNRALVALADDALGRRGRMRQGLADVYHSPGPLDVIENEPFAIASVHGAAR